MANDSFASVTWKRFCDFIVGLDTESLEGSLGGSIDEASRVVSHLTHYLHLQCIRTNDSTNEPLARHKLYTHTRHCTMYYMHTNCTIAHCTCVYKFAQTSLLDNTVSNRIVMSDKECLNQLLTTKVLPFLFHASFLVLHSTELLTSWVFAHCQNCSTTVRHISASRNQSVSH